MNLRRPPLSDIRVRQALLFGRDMKAINQLLYDGTYMQGDGPLDNVHRCFWPGATAMYATISTGRGRCSTRRLEGRCPDSPSAVHRALATGRRRMARL